jgi:hypothetical protein
MSTLLLDLATWDLTVDALGNIAVADDPYAIAQDVASALRLFRGELWYDTAQGLPYFQRVFGRPLSRGYLKAQFEAAARTVGGVATARALITGFKHRTVTGQVQLTMTSGAKALIASSSLLPWYVSAVNPNDG